MQLHISIAAETIGHILGLPITNSLLTTWIVMALILLFVFFARRSQKHIPQGTQLISELVVGGLYDFIKGMAGEKNVKKIFPLAATLFIFVLVSNWIGLLPGLSAIGLNEKEAVHETSLEAEKPQEIVEASSAAVGTKEDHGTPVAVGTASALSEEKAEPASEKSHEKFIPLFRGPTADLNTTIALALISVGSMLFFGIQTLGFGFFKRYFNFANPILFFVGILEITSDISKILSFAFRLFGNIFAGEVLLSVIGYLVPIVATVPFLGLEIFVGLIQALVFAMLTTVFIGMASTSHDHAEAHAHA